MDDVDAATFDRAFKRVSVAFRLRVSGGERQEMVRTYFRALQGYPLAHVLAAAKHCVEHLKKFPTVADWLDACAPRVTPLPADIRWMTTTEMEVQAHGVGHRYRDAPCSCVACQSAGVDIHDRRFVPSDDRAFNARRQTVELVGHWAHGDELRRWYLARAHFFASVPPRFRGLVARDPGEEG